MQLRRGREGHGGGDGQGRGACEDGARVDVDSAGSRGEGSGGDQGQVAQAADKGPSASLAPSAARSTYREYASRAAVGRRLAAGPFSSLSGFADREDKGPSAAFHRRGPRRPPPKPPPGIGCAGEARARSGTFNAGPCKSSFVARLPMWKCSAFE